MESLFHNYSDVYVGGNWCPIVYGNKDKISLIAKKKKKKKNDLPTWKNLDGWTLDKQFLLFGLMKLLENLLQSPETFGKLRCFMIFFKISKIFGNFRKTSETVQT